MSATTPDPLLRPSAEPDRTSSATQFDRRVGRISLFAAAVLILTTFVIAVAFIRPTWRPALVRVLNPRLSYATGHTVDLAESVYGSAACTLIYFGRDSCDACQTAGPIVAGAAAPLVRDGLARLAIVVTGSVYESSDAIVAVFGAPDVAIVRLPVAEQQRLRLRAVPTLLAVNQSGRILLVREGLEQLKATDLSSRLREVLR
jgi:hypothetical protein